MRKSDKIKNFKKANLLAENRYLESKGLIKDTIRNSNNGLYESNYTPHNEYEKYEKIMYIGEPRTFSNGKTVKYGDIGEYIGTEGGEECWVAFPTATGFATVFTNIKKVDEQQFESYNEIGEEYLSEDEDNLSLYKAEMKKTGDYGWTYNNGDKERAADEEIRNKKAEEGFKHNFIQKYMEQTINTTDGVYTFDNIHYLSNYGDYLVIFTRPSNDNDNVIRGHEILLWLVYDVTNGYYVKDNKKDIKLTDEDSKNKVKEMLSYNKFIQPEK